MAVALLISVLTLVIGIVFDPFHIGSINDFWGRLYILGLSSALPTLFFIASIVRLAIFRFFSPEDIDGSALTAGSREAKLLQGLLQNTLEQFIIAIGVYAAWCLLMPMSWLSTIPLASLLFAIGRIGFFKGYRKGAPSSSFGFALTFYPTVLLLLVLLVYRLASAVS